MLEIKNVYKSFNVGTPVQKDALIDLNLHLNEGDFCMIIGGNGAGKSTLMSVLFGLYQPEEGVIKKDGKEVFSEEWNGYKKGDCTHIMSATKSIMALLIGIAIDQGQIGSVDDKVLDYFPDYKVKRGEQSYGTSSKNLFLYRYEVQDLMKNMLHP